MMRTSVKGIACLGLVAAVLPLTGCMTGLKHAFYEVRGARGKVEFVQDVSPAELERYESIHFEPVASTVGPRLCPAHVRAAYDRHARELARELRERFPGGEPVLTISSEILYFQSKGLFGDAQLLTRVRFTGSGQLVGDALVVVGSKSFREGGADALAETAVDTMGKLLGGEPGSGEGEPGGERDK